MKFKINQTYKLESYSFIPLASFVSNSIDNPNDIFYIVDIFNYTPDTVRTVMRENDLVHNNIKYHVPTICNIASRGQFDFESLKRQYNIWKQMIYRCYDPNDKVYDSFGAKGVKVCYKWLCFEYFMYDWDQIPGHDVAEQTSKSCILDCTAKQINIEFSKRVYSKDTVVINPFYNSDVGRIVNARKKENESKQQSKYDDFSKYMNAPTYTGPLPVANEYHHTRTRINTNSNYTFLKDENEIHNIQAREQSKSRNLNDFKKVLSDLSFMNQYPEPQLDGKTYHAVTNGPLKAANDADTKKDGKKELCRIVRK